MKQTSVEQRISSRSRIRVVWTKRGIEVQYVNDTYNISEPVAYWDGLRWHRLATDKEWVWKEFSKKPKMRKWLMNALKKVLMEKS